MNHERQAVPRPAARVLLLDTEDRVLLFSGVDPAGARWWFPPGGGCEAGETAEETAHRELFEETGLRGVRLMCELGHRRGIASWEGATYDCQERWFLARVEPFTPDIGGFTEQEKRLVSAPRWWTVAELERTEDRLVPRSLAALVRDLLQNGPPAHPVEIEF